MEQLERHTGRICGGRRPHVEVRRLMAYRQTHEFGRIDRPSAQHRGPKTKRRIGPDRLRVGGREPTELPLPVVRRMLGDPIPSVRMAMVLPYLLKTHNVRVQLVQPRHDLIPTLRPPRPEHRVDVELHDPQHTLGHPHRLPFRSCRARPGVAPLSWIRCLKLLCVVRSRRGSGVPAGVGCEWGCRSLRCSRRARTAARGDEPSGLCRGSRRARV